MDEPEKPFACNAQNCGMTFTNEDHLHVHTKKHDMILQLGLEQKAAFVADQTPTPTRFIRNCEEVGLFQDLQNEGFTNPFDEGFKKAMESKSGLLSLQNAMGADDALHTPQMVFPVVDSADSVYSTTNNHSNITISRSSSDESGTIKEYETTTISKQTNEVTTISRVIGKQDVLDKTTTDDISIVTHQETGKEVNETVSYTNNVIKIHSNVEIRKDGGVVNIDNSKNTPMNLITYTDAVKDKIVNALSDKIVEIPMMSQKSIDHVVDSLTAECFAENPRRALKSEVGDEGKGVKPKTEQEDGFEVIIKLPSGKKMLMKAVKEETEQVDNGIKKKLKKILSEKVSKTPSDFKPVNLPNVLPITGANLYPVTIVHSTNPILSNSPRKVAIPVSQVPIKIAPKPPIKIAPQKIVKNIKEKWKDKDTGCRNKTVMEMRSAASKRYRVRLKEKMDKQAEDIKVLLEFNRKLEAENKLLKLTINNHLKLCCNGRDLRQVINGSIPQTEKTMNID